MFEALIMITIMSLFNCVLFMYIIKNSKDARELKIFVGIAVMYFILAWTCALASLYLI